MVKSSNAKGSLALSAVAVAIWAALAIICIPREVEIVAFSWPWWAIGAFSGQLQIAIAATVFGVFRGELPRAIREFAGRILFSLLTAISISLGCGFLAFAFSSLPTIARVPLAVLGTLLLSIIMFSAAVASATKALPPGAIATSVRFAVSWPGVKLILLIASTSAAAGMMTYPLLAGFPGWQPETGRLLSAVILTAVTTATSLLAGVVIWSRFCGDQPEAHSPDPVPRSCP